MLQNYSKALQTLKTLKQLHHLTLIFEAILRDAKLFPTKSKLSQSNHVLKETTQAGPEVRTPAAKVGNGRTWINFVNSIQVALLAIAGYCRRFFFSAFRSFSSREPLRQARMAKGICRMRNTKQDTPLRHHTNPKQCTLNQFQLAAQQGMDRKYVPQITSINIHPLQKVLSPLTDAFWPVWDGVKRVWIRNFVSLPLIRRETNIVGWPVFDRISWRRCWC